jgi:hypothetical protein
VKEHPPGLLALACNESARFSACYASILGVKRPTGSKVYFVSGLSIAENWNQAARVLLAEPDLQWLFLMNDDHIYPTDTLLRLLEHEVDAVSALYTERVVPFGPVLFDRVADEAGHVLRLALPRESKAQLVPIVACGDGAMLVRRSVFERVDSPWWTFGAVDADRIDHDIAFCAKLRAAGVSLFADLSTIVDHVTAFALRPVQHADGSWSIQLHDRQGAYVESLLVPATEPQEVLL